MVRRGGNPVSANSARSYVRLWQHASQSTSGKKKQTNRVQEHDTSLDCSSGEGRVREAEAQVVLEEGEGCCQTGGIATGDETLVALGGGRGPSNDLEGFQQRGLSQRLLLEERVPGSGLPKGQVDSPVEMVVKK